MKQYRTKAALPLLDAAFEGREPDTLETYFSPAQGETVYCTTQEREDFELQHQIALTQDVIEDQRDYDEFVRYLATDCELGEF